MWNTITEFFQNNEVANFIFDYYIAFIIIFFLVRFFAKSKTALSLVLPILLVIVMSFLANQFNLETAIIIMDVAKLTTLLIVVLLLANDLREFIKEGSKTQENRGMLRTTNDSKNSIAEAVLYLSSKKIGALITIEKHRMLDQYSEKAIQMNSDISKELLINIFSPLTPLHDGAVIIKGNKIRCAGAYYVLSQRDNLDKTVGSRHRAALGIAEVTDSVTIVVSEETGTISIAYSGIFMKMSDKEQLLEYIDLAMEREV